MDFSMEAMLRRPGSSVERNGLEKFVLVSWISGAPDRV